MKKLIYQQDSTNCTNLLLIDNSIRDARLFANSVNTNTYPIIYSNSSTKIELLALLKLKFTTIDRIAIVFTFGQDNLFLDRQPFFKKNTTPYSENVEFILNLIKEFNISSIDYLACNTLKYPDWVNYYNILSKETNVIVGASNNRSGNIKYGGDWIMESTSSDIEFIYFTKSIEYYKYLLDTSSSNTILIKKDKTVWGVGNNPYGQIIGQVISPNILKEMIPVNNTLIPQKIACGESHTIVLMDDGSIYGCGTNLYGELGNNSTTLSSSTLTLMINNTGKTPVNIYCGRWHTIVLMDDGSIYGCGNNEYGELGNGTDTDSLILTEMTSMTDLYNSDNTMIPKYIACHSNLTIILMENNSIYCCGNNSYGQFGNGFGQLGDGTDTDSLILTEMTSMTDLYNSDSTMIPKYIACGSNLTIILMENNSIYGCGNNEYGQLGNGTTTDSFILTEMTSMTDLYNSDSTMIPKYITCSLNLTIILMENNSIYCCGNNSFGQFGNGTTDNSLSLTEMTSMSTLLGLDKIPIKILCNYWYSVSFVSILMADGSIYCCGYNDFGQFGNGTTNNSLILTLMAPVYDSQNNILIATDISCGNSYNIILMNNNKIYGTGYNQNGELGIGLNAHVYNLTQITLPNKIPKYIANYHTYYIVLMEDGSIYGCGNNDYGQLGNGTIESSLILIPMLNNTGKIPIHITCNNNFTVVLMEDGSIYCCGDYNNGEFGSGSVNPSLTLTEITPILNKKAVYISCNNYSIVVLMEDGSIYCCGDNLYGQFGNGSTTPSITLTPMINNTGKKPIYINSSSETNVVLMDDGSIYGCGLNNIGQLGIQDFSLTTLTLIPIQDKKAIKVFCSFCCIIILMDNGDIYGYGYNHSGQLGDGTTVTTDQLTLMIPIIGKTVHDIYCNSFSTIVLMTDGTVYGVGFNYSGELGINNNDTIYQVSTLTKMSNGDDVLNLANTKSYTYKISNICFPAGTPILTDQGIIAIDKINPNKHTINHESIIEITKTIYKDEYLVCFEKDSLYINYPNNKTIMTAKHKVFFNGQMIWAKRLINNKNIYKIKYNGEILYNVLMKNHSKMSVNNMICETLNPNNNNNNKYNNDIDSFIINSLKFK